MDVRLKIGGGVLQRRLRINLVCGRMHASLVWRLRPTGAAQPSSWPRSVQARGEVTRIVEGFLSLRIKIVEVALHVSYTYATAGVSCPRSAPSSWCSTGRIRKRDSHNRAGQGLRVEIPSGLRTWGRAERFQSSDSPGPNASLGRPEFARKPSGLVGLDRIGNSCHRLLAVTFAAFKGPKLETLVGGLNGPKLHAGLTTLAAWALYREQAGEWIR